MRVPGWETRLIEAVDDARTSAFEWGHHDCATWAFGVREALTGDDDAIWRGQYRTARGAQKWLRKQGWPDVETAARCILGEPVMNLMARRGDILLSDGALGICVGRDGAFLGPDGLTFRPLRDCKMAWRV